MDHTKHQDVQILKKKKSLLNQVLTFTRSESSHVPISMGEYVECCVENPKDVVANEVQPLLKKTQNPNQEKNIYGSVFTLINTILGSGTLAVPYAMACSGWLFTNLVMAFIALVTRYSVHLLLLSSDLAGPTISKTYESLGHHCMGKYGTYLAEFTFIFGGFGTLVSYFLFISNLFQQVFGIDSNYNWLIMTVITVCFIMPLSLSRRISKLRITSLIATCAVTYVVLTIMAAYFTSEKSSNSTSVYAVDLSFGSIYTLTLLIAAFACHNTALPVYDELILSATQNTGELVVSNPHMLKCVHDNMNRAVGLAVGIAFLLYEVIALSGYSLFGMQTMDNILMNFHTTTSLYMTIGQFLMGFALLLTCPIALWPFRSCLLSVYLRAQNNGLQTSSDKASWREFLAVTLISETLILLTAIYVPSVKIPLSLVGSVSGSLIIFILPSLFYLILSDEHKDVVPRKHTVGPYLMLGCGILIGCVGFSLAVYKIVEEYLM